MSAREFNQNTSRATRLAQEEPVFVTNRGRIEYVLINIDNYYEIQGITQTSLLGAFHMPEAANIDLEIAPRTVEAPRELLL
ncbi:MAG: hypothetical protein FWF91_06020 [Coriobacteriia bacterium]|nr:hypothetical protein [Coriobacteriia bacterium]